MTPVTKQAWVDALRSGEFKQCKATMVKRDAEGTSYCCLGVLSHLAGVPERTRNGEEGFSFFKNNSWLSLGVIPPEFRDTIVTDLKLSQEVGTSLASGDLMRTLSTMNDDGATFEQIADYIDEVTSGQR